MTDNPPPSPTPTARGLTPFPFTAVVLALTFTAVIIAIFTLDPTHPAEPILDRVATPLLLLTLLACSLPTLTLARRARVPAWRLFSAAAKTNSQSPEPGASPALPKPERSRAWWLFWAVALLAVLQFVVFAGLLALGLQYAEQLPEDLPIGLVVVPVAGGFGTGVVGFVIFTYLVQRNIHAPVYPLWPDLFNRCPACGYNLTGSPPAGRCPECARPYARLNPQTPTPTDTPSTT